MVPTKPSDRIDDFIAFWKQLAGEEVADARVGASDDDIKRFESLCRHPLPPLYIAYLREFGRDDGGLMLTADADSRIEELNRFYVEQSQRNYQAVADNTVFIGIETLSGGRALHYGEDVEPRVVTTWDNTIGVTQAGSFRSFLYSQAFIQAHFPWGDLAHGSLYVDGRHLTEMLSGMAASMGFLPYWFCDGYHLCLERDDQYLVVSEDENGTGIYVSGRHSRIKDELKRLISAGFTVRDTSPRP